MTDNPDFNEKTWLNVKKKEEKEIIMQSCNVGSANLHVWFPSLGVFK